MLLPGIELGTFVSTDSPKRPAFERLVLPEYISSDILQYLIEYLKFSIIFSIFPG